MTDGTEKCNPKIEENQREDRRAFRKFIVLLLVSMVVGGITGAFSTMAAKGQADIGAGITAGLQKIAPYANLVIAAALAVWMTGMLRGGRAEYRRWDGEEEQLIEKIERKLGIGVIVTNVALIAGFFLFCSRHEVHRHRQRLGGRGSVGENSSHIFGTDCGYGHNGNRPEPDCQFYKGDQSGKERERLRSEVPENVDRKLR